MSVAIAFGLAAVIVGGVVALAIRGAKRSAARLNDAWSEAADRLGLALKPGTWAKSPVLKGSLEGYRVRLEVIAKRSGDSSRRFTRLKVSYPAALGIGLDMRCEGTWERVKKAFGAQDITIGNTDFDAGIRVGGSPEGVKMLLTRRRRLAAHRLIEDFPTAMVGDANLKWSDGGVIDDAEEVVSVINRFVSVANALAGDADRAADLDRALEAQARGDVAEAALVLEARTAPDIDPEAAFIEAPTMYAAGRFRPRRGGADHVVGGDPARSTGSGMARPSPQPSRAGRRRNGSWLACSADAGVGRRRPLLAGDRRHRW